MMEYTRKLTAVCEYTSGRELIGYVIGVPAIPTVTGQALMEVKRQLEHQVEQYCRSSLERSNCSLSFVMLYPRRIRQSC